MNFIRKVILGAGYLEGYGDHPGTVIVGAFVAMGALAGGERGGLYGAIGGGLAMLVFIGPLYIAGCIGRANEYLQRQKK